MKTSQKDLNDLFHALYKIAYTDPEIFGLPIKPDALMIPGMSKEEKQVVSRQFKKPRTTMEFGIDFLILFGREGDSVNGNLLLAKQDYETYFAKSPRLKRKFIKGMETVGFTVIEKDDGIILNNSQYPNMMLALKALSKACNQYDDKRMGRLLFTQCNFQVLTADFVPDVTSMLKAVLPQEELENAVEIHQKLAEMLYQPFLKIGGPHEWRIQFQGNRKIKSTPFFEFEYDERQENQLKMRVKCVSTNRLVPLLQDQPDSLQEDFFHHAHNCASSSCGWCKTRKALGSSVIRYGDEKRTICWWMQRHFDKADGESVIMVNHYTQLHEALLGM